MISMLKILIWAWQTTRLMYYSYSYFAKSDFMCLMFSAQYFVWQVLRLYRGWLCMKNYLGIRYNAKEKP